MDVVIIILKALHVAEKPLTSADMIARCAQELLPDSKIDFTCVNQLIAEDSGKFIYSEGDLDVRMHALTCHGRQRFTQMCTHDSSHNEFVSGIYKYIYNKCGAVRSGRTHFAAMPPCDVSLPLSSDPGKPRLKRQRQDTDTDTDTLHTVPMPIDVDDAFLERDDDNASLDLPTADNNNGETETQGERECPSIDEGEPTDDMLLGSGGKDEKTHGDDSVSDTFTEPAALSISPSTISGSMTEERNLDDVCCQVESLLKNMAFCDAQLKTMLKDEVEAVLQNSQIHDFASLKETVVSTVDSINEKINWFHQAYQQWGDIRNRVESMRAVHNTAIEQALWGNRNSHGHALPDAYVLPMERVQMTWERAKALQKANDAYMAACTPLVEEALTFQHEFEIRKSEMMD